jgi:ankyrin repeat protein
MSSPAVATFDTSALACPICFEWLDDPVTTPCGHSCCRACLSQWLGGNDSCVVCRDVLSNFDIESAGKAIVLADMVAQAKAQGLSLDPIVAKQPNHPSWTASLTRLKNRNAMVHARKGAVGKLEFSNHNQTVQFKTLLIPVVDCSGSMQGHPIAQAQTSLNNIVDICHASPLSLTTTLVAYSSTSWSIDADAKSKHIAETRSWIRGLSNDMGGTSFGAAFVEIAQVVKRRCSEDPMISGVEIVFLTDGQGEGVSIIPGFKSNMSIACPKPYHVHTVGLGASHDANFLMTLSKIGSAGEGAYRFANPDENVDALLGKIASVVNVISATTAVPIQILPPVAGKAPPVIQGERGTYWVDLIDWSEETQPVYFISIDGQTPFEVKVEMKESDENDGVLWSEWWGLQIDQITQELKKLQENAKPLVASASSSIADANKITTSIERTLHFEFLRRRAKAISFSLPTDHRDVDRLTQVIGWIDTVQKGGVIDHMKLNDAGCEGRYATEFKSSAGKAANPYSLSNNKIMDSNVPARSIFTNSNSHLWTTEDIEDLVPPRNNAALIFDLGKLKVGNAYQLKFGDNDHELKVSFLAGQINKVKHLYSNEDQSSLSPRVWSIHSSKNGDTKVTVFPPLNAIGNPVCSELMLQVSDLVDVSAPIVSHTLVIPEIKADDLITYMINRPYAQAVTWLERHTQLFASSKGLHNSNMLHISSLINRGRIAEWILANRDQLSLDIHARNDLGQNAADLAILGGCWYTFDRLWTAGVRPTIESLLLLRTVLQRAHEHTIKGRRWTYRPDQRHKFFTTASRLFEYGLVKRVPDDILNAVPSDMQDIAKWLSARNDTGMSMEKAIQMGMSDIVEQLLKSSSSSSSSTDTVKKTYSLSSCFGIFGNPSIDHVRIIDRLTSLGLIDLSELVQIKVNSIIDGRVDPNVFEDEDSWPLYAACEKGRLDMVQVLVKYLSVAQLDRANRQNTTALWIAACNNHVDVVTVLLEAGANVNIPNKNGSSALIPCCQKGLTTMVELLLAYNIDLNLYPKDPVIRDHPILQCCRVGQSKTLGLLLEHVKHNQGGDVELANLLKLDNPIDGYAPLTAATELGHVDCIQLCKDFGADLELRTSEDNQILAGATALHVACFNGRGAAVQLLYLLGADMKSKTSVLGYSLMHIAVMKGSIELVSYLRKLPTDILEAMNVEDRDGRLPLYYAYQKGNETLKEEFFTDRLCVAFEKVLASDPLTTAKCVEIMKHYGRSIGSFEYSDITNMTIGTSTVPLLTKAILNGNKMLVDCFKTMGANWYQSDSEGLSPIFWASIMNYSEKELSGIAGATPQQESRVNTMISSIRSHINASAQNKMLLNVSRGAPALGVGDVDSVSVTEIDAMSDGFMKRVDSQTLVEISTAKDASLIGWLEKLKSNTVFPDGKLVLERLIWDAKIHTISRLAAAVVSSNDGDEKKDDFVSPTSYSTGSQNLQPAHYMALYMYSANKTIFTKVNQCLSEWSTASSSVWRPFVVCLYQAVVNLPEYEGECFRTIDQVFDFDKYAIGQILSWDTFTLASLQFNGANNLIDQKRGMIFVIKSRRLSRLIAPYTSNPVDQTVLQLPGGRYEITNHCVASAISLQQANIRESKTYKAYPDYYNRVRDGKACIIIELKELVD